MQTRQQALHQWLNNFFGHEQFTISPLAGDASFRRYFRIHDHHNTFVLMDAPPDKETIVPFITVSNSLSQNGVHSPKIHAVESLQGFILLEDFGDISFLKAISSDNADDLYKSAMSILQLMQQCPTEDPLLPLFNETFMLQEMNLFRQWFLGTYLEISLSAHDEILLDDAFSWLSTSISQQPQVFIHRDYHSRNLMVIEGTEVELGVIDYQDAMKGPFTYDLVSLLKDCYIQWPRDQVITWLMFFYNQLQNTFGWSAQDYIRGFDLCGLQRHLKVLGIFCRLNFRDHKSNYLSDLPLIFNYVMSTLETCKELLPLYQFLQHKVQVPFTEKQKCTR